MPEFIAATAPSMTIKKPASLFLGLLMLLLNVTYCAKMTFPVDEPKWLLLQVFAPTLALFYTLTAIFKEQKFTLQITSFQLCMLLLFAWAAISGTWALNRISFPATLLDLSSLFIVLGFLSITLRDAEQRLPIFFVGLFSTLVATVGILQYFGVGGDIFYQSAKPASFFVNKNYASPIVAATLPLLGLTLLASPYSRKKYWVLAVYHLNFAYLLISVTKSSWFAYFGSMAIFAAIAFNSTSYRKHFSNTFLLKNLALMGSGVSFALLLAWLHQYGSFPAMSGNLLAQAGIVLLLVGGTAVTPLLTAGAIRLWRHGAARHRYLPVALLLFVCAGATSYVLSRPTPLREQISASLSVNATLDPMTTSWSTRIPLWLNSLMIIKDHPLGGVGLGSFDAAYPLYHKALISDLVYTPQLWIGGAHNEPLQLLAELGLVGFALAALGFFLISRYFHAQLKTAAPATALLLTGGYLGGLSLVLESLFNPVFHQPSTSLLLAFFIGVVHAGLYRGEGPNSAFIYAREILPAQRYFYLTPLAVLFFLMLTISGPWAARRYQAFVNHKDAIKYFNAQMDDSCYVKLREAVKSWPYSSTILSETATESFSNLQRHYSEENLHQAWDYNRLALSALPYHYIPNRIRIILLKYRPEGRGEIGKYAPLLLQVAPDDKQAEAQQEINS